MAIPEGIHETPETAVINGKAFYLQGKFDPVPMLECLCGAWYCRNCPVLEHRERSKRDFAPSREFVVSVAKLHEKRQMKIKKESS